MVDNRQVRQPLPLPGNKDQTGRKHLRAAAAVLLVSQLINIYLPKNVAALDIPALDRKLKDIKQQKSRFDFVFLGSSRIYRGIDAIEIDQEAGKRGCDINTYNFGIAGLSILEQKYVLDRLHESGVGIDSIYIEPYSVPIRDTDNFFSDRRRYSYTWNNLPSLLIDQLTEPDKTKDAVRRERIRYMLFAFIQEQSGVGRLSHLIFPQPAKHQRQWDSPIRKGYLPLDEESAPKFKARKKRFSRRAGKFMKEIEKAIEHPNKSRNSKNRYSLVLGVVNHIHSMSITPGVIIMPKPAYISHARDLESRLIKETSGSLPIINLNSPVHYSDLFTLDNFYDGSHLSDQGARVLAVHLANELCTLKGQQSQNAVY